MVYAVKTEEELPLASLPSIPPSLYSREVTALVRSGMNFFCKSAQGLMRVGQGLFFRILVKALDVALVGYLE
jgi:hypothetical protein